MQPGSLDLDINQRKDLFNFVQEVIDDSFYQEILKNISKIEIPNRYFNWYYGYTDINYPFYSIIYDQLFYQIDTSTTSGKISTQYFGEIFNKQKFDRDIWMVIKVHIPEIMLHGNDNTTLMLEIEKLSVKDIYGKTVVDDLRIDGYGILDADEDHYSFNITDFADSSFSIKLDRKVSKEKLNKMKVIGMPGFQLSWYYDPTIENLTIFDHQEKRKELVR